METRSADETHLRYCSRRRGCSRGLDRVGVYRTGGRVRFGASSLYGLRPRVRRLWATPAALLTLVGVATGVDSTYLECTDGFDCGILGRALSRQRCSAVHQLLYANARFQS